METVTITFHNQEDFTTIEKIMKVLEMKVQIHPANSLAPENHYQLLDKELEAYKSGKSKASSWEEICIGLNFLKI